MDILVQLLVWIVETLIAAVRTARNRRELAAAGIDPGALGLPDDVAAGELKERMREEVEGRIGTLRETVEAARAVMERATSLERDLLAVPSGRLLRDLFRDGVRPELERGAERIRAVVLRAEGLPHAQAVALLADREQVSAYVALRWAILRANVLIALRDARADPAAAHHLADAEAIATSLLAPLREFAPGHGIELVTARPIATPAVPGGEAIWLGLLPHRHPILFVPADFESDLYRYASVPHELGHLLWRDVPGLGAEVVEAMGIQPEGGLLGVREGRLAGSLDQLFFAWSSELFADAMAILLLGPAALRGLCHSFASPQNPDAVLLAGVSSEDDDAYAEHPPAHVRVHLAAHLLWTMGFDQQASVLRGDWDTRHGNPEHLAVALTGERFARLPAEFVLEAGREIVGRLYMHAFRSLGGFRLADVPGFEMSPGTWATVLRRADQLVADVPFNDEGRVVLAAAIEARALHPHRTGLIVRGLRRAVLGEDTDERRVVDPAYAQRTTAPTLRLAEELRQALILREVLHRPRQRGVARR